VTVCVPFPGVRWSRYRLFSSRCPLARRQHRRAADRHVAVLDVLLHLAPSPGRARR
jgi:hypothetical protein